MYVNAILNLTVQRLRAIAPDWLNAVNSYVTPGPVDDGNAVGRHWLNVFYAGSAFEHADGGNLGRRWRMGLAYYHIVASDQTPRYTLDALQIVDRMRQITGYLDLTTGPTGLHLWMPCSVSTLSFTTRARTISAITLANPGKVTTTAAHNFLSGQQVKITGSTMTQVNGNTYTITVTDSTNFTIGVDTTAFTAHTGTASCRRIGAAQTIIQDRTIRLASGAASGQVADVQVTSGTWATGDAAGTIYLGNVSGTWGAGQVNADAYGTAAAAVVEVGTSAGAATLTQLAAQPIRITSEQAPREIQGVPFCLSVQQEYEVITIA